MQETFNFCTRSEIWVYPKNWETTTAKSSLKKTWYVQCFFHDPAFAEKYPKGFPYRVKANKGTYSLESRRAAVKFVLEHMALMLDVRGYNPITKTYMRYEEVAEETPLTYNKSTPLHIALQKAFDLTEVEEHTRKDIKSVVKYFLESCAELKLEKLPVNEFLPMHATETLRNVKTKKNIKAEALPLSEKRYNKYIAYLTGMFTILYNNKMVDANPFKAVKPYTSIEVQPREILSKEDAERVNNFLHEKYPEFWLFMNIFRYSGGREIELLRLKKEDVCLTEGEWSYTTLVKKQKTKTRVTRPIQKRALPFWTIIMNMAEPGEYLFSKFLLPGSNPINRDQISRRWRVHVKKKLGITADFYAYKHLNLSEISEKLGPEAAAIAAGHKSTHMVIEHYDVTYKQRLMNQVRHLSA